MTITFKDNLTPDEAKKAAGLVDKDITEEQQELYKQIMKDKLEKFNRDEASVKKADIDDTKSVRLGLYQTLYRIKNKGFEPEFIYLGVNWLRALDDLARAETSSYGERIATFCDVPVIEVVGHPYHFRVSIKEPEL